MSGSQTVSPEIVELGWCANWLSCRGVRVECIRGSHGELCVRCTARLLGLDEATATAGACVAEMMRREGVAA